MDDDSGDDSGNNKNGKLIPFPGGKEVDAFEVGVDDYVATHVGTIPQGELIDPRSIDQDVRDRVEYVERQELVTIAKSGSPTSATIELLLQEIAEEAAHLKWERRQNAKKGKSTAQLTVARIGSLKQMTDILIKRKESSLNERLTVKDPRVKKFFELWMEMFYEAMDKTGIGSELIDLVFAQVKADMVEWEIKMNSIEESS